jgi:hypothetical protein
MLLYRVCKQCLFTVYYSLQFYLHKVLYVLSIIGVLFKLFTLMSSYCYIDYTSRALLR